MTYETFLKCYLKESDFLRGKKRFDTIEQKFKDSCHYSNFIEYHNCSPVEIEHYQYGKVLKHHQGVCHTLEVRQNYRL